MRISDWSSDVCSSDLPPLPSLAKLDEKLRAAEAKRRKSRARSEIQGQGLAFALRIGVEIVAALIVGVGIGLLLDWWLGTKPWFLLLFFVLGAAAGFMNVFRVDRKSTRLNSSH